MLYLRPAHISSLKGQ